MPWRHCQINRGRVKTWGGLKFDSFLKTILNKFSHYQNILQGMSLGVLCANMRKHSKRKCPKWLITDLHIPWY